MSVTLSLSGYWTSGALSALFLIDKQGRRKLLIGSYLGMVSAIHDVNRCLLTESKATYMSDFEGQNM